MSRYQDFRNNVPYGHNLSEEEAALEYLESGQASKHEACEILKRWPGIQSRNQAEHEQRRQEYNEFYAQNAQAVSTEHSQQQPRRMTDREQAELERDWRREGRAIYRERQDRLREEEHARQQEQEAERQTQRRERESALQAQHDGIQRTRNGRPVYVEPQLTEGDSIEIKMPGEPVFTRIFTALIGSRK